MTRKAKPTLPTDKGFDASLSMRYAEELRQRQGAGGFGVFNQGSHNLQANELLMSNMVMQGLNNLAYVTLKMQEDARPALQMIPVSAD
ncbi:MAG: hypothetical protein HEQ32_03045 [Vampirovibrio sp.]|jgi:hypothetical protein